MIVQFIRAFFGLREPSPQVRSKKTWGYNPDCPDCGRRLVTTDAKHLRMWCTVCREPYQCHHWPVSADYFKKENEDKHVALPPKG